MSDVERRARRRGKNFERTVAKALGGRRKVNRGTATSDLDGVPWSVECTRTKKGASAVRTKWEQAVRNAGLEGQEPVLVVAEPGQRIDDALVVCRFGLFAELANGTKEEAE